MTNPTPTPPRESGAYKSSAFDEISRFDLVQVNRENESFEEMWLCNNGAYMESNDVLRVINHLEIRLAASGAARVRAEETILKIGAILLSGLSNTEKKSDAFRMSLHLLALITEINGLIKPFEKAALASREESI